MFPLIYTCVYDSSRQSNGRQYALRKRATFVNPAWIYVQTSVVLLTSTGVYMLPLPQLSQHWVTGQQHPSTACNLTSLYVPHVLYSYKGQAICI